MLARSACGLGAVVMRVASFRLGSLVAGVLMLASAPVRAGVTVTISKADQRLAVVVDGAETFRWPVSTGRPGYQTPSGTYHPIRLEPRWYSHKYNMTPMPWSMFFYRGYAVHGTLEARNLGRAVSHGCVRLRPDNASRLFALVRREGAQNVKFVVTNESLPRLHHSPLRAHAIPMPAVDPRDDNANARTHDRTRAKERDAAADAKAAADTAARDPAPKRSGGRNRHVAARVEAVPIEATPAGEKEGPERRPAVPRPRIGVPALAYSVSTGSDEARILRERAAWLHSIDRAYGIVR